MSESDEASGTGSALVLGGGGVTGVAWELGILAGLQAAGADLSTADLLVGTSAGSVVAAQLGSGRALPALYESQLAPPTGEIAANFGFSVLVRYVLTMARSRDLRGFGARIGAAATRARTVSESDRRRAIESRMPTEGWPTRALKITAVDAATGEFTVFTRDSGVDLVDAIGASCAVPLVWPPVTIGEHRYIDGGMRSAANADLASGYQRVVVIAPITRAGGPLLKLPAQVAGLRAAGSAVVVVSPDEPARRAIGRNVLDPSRRAAAAQAGYAQAARVAADIAALWSPTAA